MSWFRSKGSDLPQVRGMAHKIQFRREAARVYMGLTPPIIDICTFRIQCFDEKGNPAAVAGVELRSKCGFAGDLTEGDMVCVYDTRSKGGTISTTAVRNLTTQAVFGNSDEANRRNPKAPPMSALPNQKTAAAPAPAPAPKPKQVIRMVPTDKDRG